jgi:hypothetical protein
MGILDLPGRRKCWQVVWFYAVLDLSFSQARIPPTV